MAYYNAARPRYGFGRGLSYTAFDCRLEAAGEEGVSFTLTNTGGRGGWAVPQLYLHRRQGVVTSRTRQLCGFTKVLAGAGGGERALTIPIPRESLAQWDLQMRHRVLPRADRVVPV